MDASRFSELSARCTVSPDAGKSAKPTCRLHPSPMPLLQGPEKMPPIEGGNIARWIFHLMSLVEPFYNVWFFRMCPGGKAQNWDKMARVQ